MSQWIPPEELFPNQKGDHWSPFSPQYTTSVETERFPCRCKNLCDSGFDRELFSVSRCSLRCGLHVLLLFSVFLFVFQAQYLFSERSMPLPSKKVAMSHPLIGLAIIAYLTHFSNSSRAATCIETAHSVYFRYSCHLVI